MSSVESDAEKAVEQTGTSGGVGAAWDRVALSYQKSAQLPSDVVGYGPGIGNENDYRLIGNVAGKRVLELGCGGGQSAIAFAKQGAISIGVDISVQQLAYARRLVEEEEVKVELRHGDLAELAFQRADTVDVVFSAFSLQYVPDLNRVFRQVHRVLKPSGALVFSIPHPAAAMVSSGPTVLSKPDQLTLETPNPEVVRSYFDHNAIKDPDTESSIVAYHHTMSEIYMGLTRSGFRIEVMQEPDLGDSRIPKALLMRARKES